MSSTARLFAFVAAQFDKDEQVARAVELGPGVGVELWHGTSEARQAQLAFMDRFDEERALRQVAAGRKLLEEYRYLVDRGPETDEQLHARFAHPAYEYAVTEGPRKMWDYAGVSPEGDGWERNIDAGRAGTPDAGWDRLDYTEEAYWRRRLPADQIREDRPPLGLRLLAAPYDREPEFEEDWRV